MGDDVTVVQTNQRADAIWRELQQAGVQVVVWLPDSETHFMHDHLLGEDPTIRVVQVCKEGEAIAICAGLHMGGVKAALVIENQGLFDAGNALKWALSLKVPLLALVGYVHFHKLEHTPEGVLVAGVPDVTEPFISAFGIPYAIVATDEDVAQVGVLAREAFTQSAARIALVASADRYHPGT